MSDNMKILIVGSGYMGTEYCKVLLDKGYTPLVVGRGIKNAEKIASEFNVEVLSGGIENAVNSINPLPAYAIVAVNVDCLSYVSKILLESGMKHILIEKPAGINRAEIKDTVDLARKHSAAVYVAYNRRFYSSVKKALDIIYEDGGVSSFHFEFTEWSSSIESSPHSAAIKEAWMLANSSHVIDLAFFLGGFPNEMSSYINNDGLAWHPRCSCYVGAGISDKNVPFSYCANWDAPGRWAIEVMTKKHRLYFKPMEKLSIQEKNSVQINPVDINDDIDIRFKPGLYKQIEAFIEGDDAYKLVSIDSQLKNMDWYEKIACI